MWTKLLAALIALALVGGGVYLWYEKAQAPTAPAAPGVYNWTFEDAGQDAQGNPQTSVSLNGRQVGTYQGTCQEIDGSGWQLLLGEQSGVICWWAGGGTEMGIFDGAVKEGTLYEGSAEVPGSRGDFHTLFAL